MYVVTFQSSTGLLSGVKRAYDIGNSAEALATFATALAHSPVPNFSRDTHPLDKIAYRM